MVFPREQKFKKLIDEKDYMHTGIIQPTEFNKCTGKG